jgi:hypothetical protein
MANFNFKSPSVKFQELDRSFASTPSLGITSVGIVGETLKGPAFSDGAGMIGLAMPEAVIDAEFDCDWKRTWSLLS